MHRIQATLVAPFLLALPASAQHQVIMPIVSGDWELVSIRGQPDTQEHMAEHISIVTNAMPITFGKGTADYTFMSWPGGVGGSVTASTTVIHTWKYKPKGLWEGGHAVGNPPTGHGKSGGVNQEIEILGKIAMMTPGLWGGNASGLAFGRVDLTDSIGQNVSSEMSLSASTETTASANIDIPTGKGPNLPAINIPSSTGWGTYKAKAKTLIPEAEKDLNKYVLQIKGSARIGCTAGRGWWASSGGNTVVDLAGSLFFIYVLYNASEDF